MSGDVVDIATKSFYKSGGTVTSPNSILSDVINSLAGGIVTATSGAHGVVTDLTNSTSGPVYAAVNSFLPTNDPNTTGKPKAYLNWILLDDQFKGVTTYPQSGAIVVGSADVLNTLAYSGIPITKSGYLYIWVSNETPGWDVFFDNLSVKQYSGPVTEETHYYPFGLTMAGISSKALNGVPENKYKYNKGAELQNKEFSDGSGLEMYDTHFRQLDPQVGRWWQIDPKSDSLYGLTPYNSMVNDPIDLNDPNGDIIEFDENASGKFKLNVLIAAVKLLVNGVGGDLIQLAGSKKTYTFSETNGDVNSFQPNSDKGGTISWNPYKALLTTNDIKLSPTTLLNHELDHAAGYDRNLSKFIDDIKNTNMGAYDNAEEKRVITGMEQKTALALGEIKPGQVTRFDHSFKALIRVTWPNSTSGISYLPPGYLAPIILNLKRKKSKSN